MKLLPPCFDSLPEFDAIGTSPCTQKAICTVLERSINLFLQLCKIVILHRAGTKNSFHIRCPWALQCLRRSVICRGTIENESSLVIMLYFLPRFFWYYRPAKSILYVCSNLLTEVLADTSFKEMLTRICISCHPAGKYSDNSLACTATCPSDQLPPFTLRWNRQQLRS